MIGWTVANCIAYLFWHKDGRCLPKGNDGVPHRNARTYRGAPIGHHLSDYEVVTMGRPLGAAPEPDLALGAFVIAPLKEPAACDKSVAL